MKVVSKATIILSIGPPLAFKALNTKKYPVNENYGVPKVIPSISELSINLDLGFQYRCAELRTGLALPSYVTVQRLLIAISCQNVVSLAFRFGPFLRPRVSGDTR